MKNYLSLSTIRCGGVSLACGALALALLSACGGGGAGASSAPAAAPANNALPTSNQRVSKMNYRYDAGSANDATVVFRYDTQGRLMRRDYTYTDNGTTDVVKLHGVDAAAWGYTFDAQGRVATDLTANITQGDSITHSAQYDGNGRVVRNDLVGNISSTVTQQYMLYSYTGSLLTQIDSFQGNGSPLARQIMAYDGNGRMVKAEAFSPPGASAPATRYEYTWRSDGQIDTFKTDANADGTYENIMSFTYDGNNKLARVSTVIGGTYAASIKPMTYIMVYNADGSLARVDYDQLSDGSVDASVSVEYESAVCQPFVDQTQILPGPGELGRGFKPGNQVNYCQP